MNCKLLLLSCALGASCAASAQQGAAVVRDAETGQLRAPTAAELRAMQAKDPQPKIMAPQPRSSLRPDGTRSAKLGERGMVYAVVTRAADGTLVRTCVKDGQAVIEGKEEQHEHP